MRENKLRRNIKLDYIFSGLNNITLINAIWMLYFVSKGLSLIEIGVIETVYHFVSFVGEVPTGAIADIYGRKVSRLLGKAISILGTVIILLSKNAWGIGIGFVMTAIAVNLESGTGRALIYDTLIELNEEKKFSSILAKLTIFLQITGIVNILVGGYIATIDYNYVYMLSILIGCVTLAIAYFFTEPEVHQVESREVIRKSSSMLSQMVDATKTVVQSKILTVTILFDAVSGMLIASIFMYLQLLLKSQGLNEFEIALSMVSGGITAIIFSSFAERIRNKFSASKLLVVLSLVWVIGSWGMAFSTLRIVSFFLIYGIQALTGIYNSSIINKNAASDKRATILSFGNMIFSVFMMIAFPIWGWIGDSFGVAYVFVAFAIITTLLLPIISLTVHHFEKA